PRTRRRHLLDNLATRKTRGVRIANALPSRFESPAPALEFLGPAPRRQPDLPRFGCRRFLGPRRVLDVIPGQELVLALLLGKQKKKQGLRRGESRPSRRCRPTDRPEERPTWRRR